MLNISGDWIQSSTGQKVYPLNPKPENFTLDEIANSLSKKCRYNGHCTEFYSVAQHSVLVSYKVKNKLWGLLHEFDEVFLPDVARPLKPLIPGWEELCAKHTKAGAESFKLQYPMPNEILVADLKMLATEKEQLMVKEPDVWNLPYEPYKDVKIEPLDSESAKKLFINRFYKLTK